jgi:hypothetical protein
MKKLRNIFRIIFFLTTVVLLVFLNTKANDNTKSVVEFKINMLQKLRTDSLNSKQKAELLVSETAKYVEDTSRVKTGLNYLTLLFAIAIVVECIFLILGKTYTAKN